MPQNELRPHTKYICSRTPRSQKMWVSFAAPVPREATISGAMTNGAHPLKTSEKIAGSGLLSVARGNSTYTFPSGAAVKRPVPMSTSVPVTGGGVESVKSPKLERTGDNKMWPESSEFLLDRCQYCCYSLICRVRQVGQVRLRRRLRGSLTSRFVCLLCNESKCMYLLRSH